MPKAFKKIIKFCENCGQRLTLRNTRDIKRKRFCSRSCCTKYNRKNGIIVSPWTLPDVVQKMKRNMKKPHTITEAFLKSATIRGENRRGKHINAKQIKCEYCNKKFYVPISRIDGRINYCSLKCKNLASLKPDYLKTDQTRLNDWAKDVKERDDYACRECGCKKKRLLQSHHVISKAENPNLYYELFNGITLCAYCHIKHHKKSLTNFILSSLNLKGLKKPYAEVVQ